MTSSNDTLCPACGRGHLVPRFGDYATILPDGQAIVVPGIEYKKCDECEETSISLESSLKVDAYIAAEIEQLSTRELGAIRESFCVDQTEMSEILGLGVKTYHRWERGNQIPSRSMGFYLRVLQRFPEAFDWLRKRGWRDDAKVIHVDFSTAFPSLGEVDCTLLSQRPKQNPAKALFGRVAL